MQPCRQIRNHATMQSCPLASNMQPCQQARRQASNRVTKHASNQLSQASQAGRLASKQGGKQACCTHACNHASGQARKQPCTHAIIQASKRTTMQPSHAIKPCNQTMQTAMQPNQAPKQDRKRACDHANEKATMGPWPTLTSPTYRQLVSTSQ